MHAAGEGRRPRPASQRRAPAVATFIIQALYLAFAARDCQESAADDDGSHHRSRRAVRARAWTTRGGDEGTHAARSARRRIAVKMVVSMRCFPPLLSRQFRDGPRSRRASGSIAQAEGRSTRSDDHGSQDNPTSHYNRKLSPSSVNMQVWSDLLTTRPPCHTMPLSVPRG
jgi:hypothetical protein